MSPNSRSLFCDDVVYTGVYRWPPSTLEGDAGRRLREAFKGFFGTIEYGSEADCALGTGTRKWLLTVNAFGLHGEYSVTAPFWLAALIFTVYPALAFIRGPLRRYRRRKLGLCVTCGYDLRGSSDLCPECGEVLK